jgi:TrmH family RNA methyltransferase
MKTVASPENPLIKTIRRLQQKPHHRGDNRLILEGVKLANEALSSGIGIDQAVLSFDFSEAPSGRALRDRLEAAGVPSVAVDQRLFRRCSSLDTPEGILLLARRELRPLTELTGELVVLSEGVQDPGNLGAIARVAEAAGASALVTCVGSAHPFHPKALRGSMGSLLRVPIFDGGEGEAAGRFLKRKGLRLAACLPRGGADFRSAELRGALVLMLGREGGGLSDNLLKMSDMRLSVPMKDGVDSLNVAVVAGLLLYEAARQRGALKP